MFKKLRRSNVLPSPHPGVAMSKEAWAYLTENYFTLVCQINALPLLVAHSYHYENIMIMKNNMML